MKTSKNITPEIAKAIASGTSREITEIIIHCSATKSGVDFKAADIRRWHVSGRHFTDIGYHFVIDLDGTIELGRPLSRIGAHCLGHNRNSIGICYVGGLDPGGSPTDTRTEAQKLALHALIAALRSRFPRASIHGHSEFANKACPCFNVKTAYASLI